MNPWIKVVIDFQSRRSVHTRCKDLHIAEEAIRYLRLIHMGQIFVIIDDVEYGDISSTDATIEEIMDAHLSFYSEEYNEGLEQEAERLKQLNADRRYKLLGNSLRDHDGNKPLVQLSRSKDLNVISRKILNIYYSTFYIEWSIAEDQRCKRQIVENQPYKSYTKQDMINLINYIKESNWIKRLRLEHQNGTVDVPFLQSTVEQLFTTFSEISKEDHFSKSIFYIPNMKQHQIREISETLQRLIHSSE